MAKVVFFTPPLLLSVGSSKVR